MLPVEAAVAQLVCVSAALEVVTCGANREVCSIPLHTLSIYLGLKWEREKEKRLCSR